ncbi:MAG: hypothetical protein EB127_15915 [Alphaproteobacteria bacterium]|nr:hypothetical protein [Alphaproteobacteria bacterium]
MIQLQVDPKTISVVEKVISEKVQQAEVIVSSTSLTEIAKAIFTITANQFLRDLSAVAMQEPERYHHLYEWSAVGSTQQKLFRMKRKNVNGGRLTIAFEPLKSVKPVPISTRLLEPGETGKRVSSEHIFREKMRIMESGQPIHYETKKTIAFSPDGNRIVFVPKDNVINIMNPGGSSTTGALKSFSEMWYSNTAPNIVSQSRLIRQIGNEVAKTLNQSNSNSSKVKDTIKKVTSKYSKEVTVV